MTTRARLRLPTSSGVHVLRLGLDTGSGENGALRQFARLKIRFIPLTL